MKKQEKKGNFKGYLFCRSDVSLQRYETSKIKKTRFSQNRQLYTTFTLQIRPEILI